MPHKRVDAEISTPISATKRISNRKILSLSLNACLEPSTFYDTWQLVEFTKTPSKTCGQKRFTVISRGNGAQLRPRSIVSLLHNLGRSVEMTWTKAHIERESAPKLLSFNLISFIFIFLYFFNY